MLSKSLLGLKEPCKILIRAISTTPNKRDYLDRNLNRDSDSTFFVRVVTIGVRLFQIITFICNTVCVGMLHSNCTVFLCALPADYCQEVWRSVCLYRANLEGMLHTQALTTGKIIFLRFENFRKDEN